MVLAPAKLNLFLKVFEKSGDYHNIYSLVCFIDIFDEIKIMPTDDISVSSELNLGKSDLVYKAVCLLKQISGCGFGADVSIKKRIPIASGMGGASSDAAMTLRKLNKLWRLNLSKNRLMKIALMCGSDLPLFFEDSSLLLVSGIGEKIKPVNLSSALYFVIVYPGVQISAKSAYSWHDLLTTGKTTTIKHLPATIDFETIAEIVQNDLQAPVASRSLAVKEALEVLSEKAKEGVVFMTGSGSSVVGMFKNEERRNRCYEEIKFRKGWRCFKARSIRLSEELLKI